MKINGERKKAILSDSVICEKNSNLRRPKNVMLYEERRDKILQILNETKYTTVPELADKLHFSESTIRRDLKKLEQERMVYCAHGGITSNIHPNLETPLQLRLSTNRHTKSIIARRAADMVEDNMIVMMDASTSVMEMIPYLRNKKNLTIITCCLSTAIQVSELLDCTLICTGGRYHAPVGSLVGVSAEATIRNWFADIMFFSVNSIDPVNGLTDQGEEVAHMKSVMLNQTRKAVLLADSSKFGQTSAFRLTHAPITYIITNSDPRFDDECWKEYRSKMIFTDHK